MRHTAGIMAALKYGQTHWRVVHLNDWARWVHHNALPIQLELQIVQRSIELANCVLTADHKPTKVSHVQSKWFDILLRTLLAEMAK